MKGVRTSNIQLYTIIVRCEQRDGPPRPSALHVTGRLKKTKKKTTTFSRTANGRTSGRTQIVIIVQTQESCNSTILKLPLENGIFSPVVLPCHHFVTAWLVWT